MAFLDRRPAAAISDNIRLAGSHARFGVKLGWIGGGGMIYLLAHSIGSSNAALMLMTDDPIDAARALSWGLVSEVLASRALALAQTIAARAPLAAETAFEEV